MNLAIEVIDQDGDPVPGVEVDVFLDEATSVAGNQHSGPSGEIALSNKTPCAGHPLKFVASKEGYETLEHIHHPHSNSVTVKLQIKKLPPPPPPSPSQTQSKVIVALVCLLLGALGIHRLIMGYSKWWLMIIVSVVTLGIGGVLWALIDFVRILTGSLKMADGQDLR